ncbi:hypothetical protein ACFP9V_05390 [Deinococcus radiopugnans]|uniref:hypothetical protein n=1 Tax=Deinococcus radiopugnans TaxID=57497 RepID=UPI00360A75BD
MSAVPASLPLRPYVIRDVTDPWAMRGLEGVQVDAWGYPDREVLPSSMFRISSVCGGVVLGAYAAPRLACRTTRGPLLSGWPTAFRRCGTGSCGTTRTCWRFTRTGAAAGWRWPSNTRSGSGCWRRVSRA